MTRDEFKKELDKNSYKWTEEGEWIIVSEEDYVILDYLESIPDNIQFNNRGNVYLQSLESIPSNVRFNNEGGVNLESLETMPGNVQFNNKGCVDLNSVKSIGNNIQFNNKGYVDLDSVKSIGNNIQFNNGDFVYLGSLKSIPINIDTEVMFPKCLDIYIEQVWINNIPFSDSRWTSVEGKVQMYESWIKNNY